MDRASRRQVINTPSGNLILDETFANKIFLKGILLDKGSVTGKEFSYGYNLLEGKVDRERQKLKSPQEQGQLLTKIWATVIQKDPSLLSYYVKLFRSEAYLLSADVELAEDYITSATAAQIWEPLLATNVKKGFFYYDCKSGKRVRYFQLPTHQFSA